MCGIAGAVGEGGWTPETMHRVQARLSHRGPDAEGAWSKGHANLVHTRLRVIDLSEAGRQPMWSDDGRVGIVYNGEIYNFRSLRSRLRDRGRTFRSRTDTEVVLEAWAEWGADALERLEGIFAFAVWEGDRDRLTLARDRLGVKPLYWSLNEEGKFVFASEVRALLAADTVAPELNVGALPQFLTQQTVATPATLVRGVHMLRPGCRLSVELADGRATEPDVRRYWNPFPRPDASRPDEGDERTSLEAAGRKLEERLLQALRRQQVADVPVGAFLSGGLDSTIVVALLTEVADEPVSTFTVVSGEESYADRDHARLVAEEFGTEHREVELSDEELAARVPEALAAQDHPSADGVNTFVVSKAAREAGLTVALSGLGADELFGGYPTFGRLRLVSRARPFLRSLPRTVKGGVAGTVRLLTDRVYARKAAAILETDGSVAEAYPTIRAIYPPAEGQRILASTPGPSTGSGASGWSRSLSRAFAERPALTTAEAVAYAEQSCYMHDVLLRDTDQMSMAHSLEVRVPMLDDAVVSHVLSLRPEVRFPGETVKGLLVEAMSGRIPDAVTERCKRPFALPLDRWMRGPVRATCEVGIERVAAHPAFDGGEVREVWRRFRDGDGRIAWRRPWLLVALGQWMEREGVS